MSRNFDGVDDTITCGNPAQLNNLSAFTWCAWIRPVNMGEGNVGRVFDKFEKILYATTTNTFGAYINRATAASDIAAANNTLTTSAWNFVAMTFDGTTTKLYHGAPGAAVTDVSPADNGSGAPVADNTRVFTIGNNSGGTAATFNGRIEHARVYSAALSQNELTAAMYNRPIRSGNLVGYWPLIGGSPEPDWSGNGANGTVTGAAVADAAPVPPPWIGDEDFLAWVSASGVSGTIAANAANATSSISGTTTVVGTVAASSANHTSAITGTTTVIGTMAALLANATSAITGTTTVTGTIAAVLQACTSAISATTTVLGWLAATLANAVSAITGDAGSPPPATGNVLWWFRRRGRR